MSFLFEYTHIKSGGHFIGSEGISVQGSLVKGELCISDSIYLNTKSGELIKGEVVRFVESFDDWLGLPFYDKVVSDSDGVFCVELILERSTEDIMCPGTIKPEQG